MLQIVLIAALLWCPCSHASSSQTSDFDFLKEKLEWSCAVPLEEEMPLNETAAGSRVITNIFVLVAEATSDQSIDAACQMSCEQQSCPQKAMNCRLQTSALCENLPGQDMAGFNMREQCKLGGLRSCDMQCDGELNNVACPDRITACSDRVTEYCTAKLCTEGVPPAQCTLYVANCLQFAPRNCGGTCGEVPCQIQRDTCQTTLRNLVKKEFRSECRDWSYAELENATRAVPPGKFPLVGRSPWNASERCVMLAGNHSLPLDCPDGMYCLGGSAQPRACRKGLFCTSGTVRPAPCPAGRFCPVSSINISCEESVHELFEGVKCMPDETNRTFAPEPCPAGSFCKQGRDTTCPAGSFCPLGASRGVQCVSGEACGKGSARPGRLGSVAATQSAILGGIFVLTASMHLWWLPPDLWWLRLAVFMVLILGMWFYEVPKPDRDLSVPAYLTGLYFILGWGIFVSPQYRHRLQPWAYTAVDGLAYGFSAAVASVLSEDLMVGAFMIPMLPAGALLKTVLCEEGLAGQSKLLMVVVGVLLTVLCIGLVQTKDSWLTAGFYVLLMLLVGADALVRGVLQVLFPSKFAVSTLKHLPVPRDSLVDGEQQQGMWMELSNTRKSYGQALDSSASCHSLDAGVQLEEVGISVEFRKVNLSLPGGQKILNDISLRIPASSSVAIMGPSGCGKSSITNVLSGRAGYGKVEGDILINGQRDRSVGELRCVTGFVPQDDVMYRNLTVEENVLFQAELRMPRGGGEGQSRDRSDRATAVAQEATRVLTRLGLGDPQLRRTLIGDENSRGVSGGQRKRVSIAMELVARPSLLFLDEPTTGLDSTTSHSVVEMVTAAARESRCTTLAVIHQPRYETLLLFDRLMLLAAGGYLVYSGPSASARDYFVECLHVRFPEKANPADTFMDAITLESAREMVQKGTLAALDTTDRPRFGTDLAALWKARGAKKYGHVPFELMHNTLPALKFETCTWGEEILVQIKRGFLQFRRDWVSVVVNNGLLVFGLLCLCLGWRPKNPTDDIMQPMLALMFLMLTQGVAAQRIFGGNNRSVGWREASSSISTVFCFLGRDIAALVDMLVGTAVFTLVYWPLGPLLVRQHHMVWVCFAFTYAVWGLSYIGSITLNPGGAQMMAVVAAFTGELLAGVQPEFVSMAKAVAGHGVFLMAISPIRWASGILMLKHMAGTMAGTEGVSSQFSNHMIQYLSNDQLVRLGMPLTKLTESNWTCSSGRSWNWGNSRTTHERWLDDGNGYVCSTKQLLLIGFYYRFVALMCMLIISRKRVTGGGHTLEAQDGSRFSGLISHVLRFIVPLFFVVITHLQMVILLKTL